ncbi:MAG: hypothetical protein HY861_02035 [Chlamydiia bacterium]|nr:hypothetical protein [Chlamydiia bacterium]
MPIGNPSAPSILEQGCFIPDTSWANLQASYTADWLFQERFIARCSSQELGLRKALFSGSFQVGTLLWNVLERFDLGIEMGSGQFFWRWEQSGKVAISGTVSEGMVWGGRAKLIVFEIRDTTFAIDGHAGGWDWMNGPAASNGIPLLGETHSEMRYWQISVALAQKMALFTPYIGFVANRTRLKIDRLESGVGWLRSLHTIGAFLGCSVSYGRIFFLNVESRGGFEQGVSVTGQIRF